MKIYLVEKNNCEPYEDYHSWIETVYTSYRDASQSLIDDGFEAYYWSINSIGDLRFYWQESDEYMADCQGARVLERELKGVTK